jgi:RNA polymerase sigma factor (sigma-70 family)
MLMKNDVLSALETAYRKHADYVFGLCMKLAAGDRSWALDRTHDVFIRLSENLNKLNLEEDLRPWLRTVAVNECFLDLRRRERRHRLLGVFGFTSDEIPAPQERDVAIVRDVIALDRALKRLPAKERVLLGLMYFEGESLTEAAERIGVSKGQASKLHKKALERLSQLEWETRETRS